MEQDDEFDEEHTLLTKTYELQRLEFAVQEVLAADYLMSFLKVETLLKGHAERMVIGLRAEIYGVVRNYKQSVFVPADPLSHLLTSLRTRFGMHSGRGVRNLLYRLSLWACDRWAKEKEIKFTSEGRLLFPELEVMDQRKVFSVVSKTEIKPWKR